MPHINSYMLPGEYYYGSRYTSKTGAVFHLVKYWLFAFVCFHWLSSVPITLSELLFFAAIFPLHLACYDKFCQANDTKSAHENFGVQRSYATQAKILPWSIIVPGIIATAFIGGILVSAQSLLICIGYFAWLYGVFATHNLIDEKLRPLTYFLLYLTKMALPVVIYAVGTGHWIANGDYIYLAITFSAAYLPAYTFKKWGVDRYSKFTKAVYFKLLLLAIYIPVAPAFIFIVVFILLVTALEKAVSADTNEFTQNIALTDNTAINPGIYSFLNPYTFHVLRKNAYHLDKFDGIYIDGFLLCKVLSLFGIQVARRSFDFTSLAHGIFEHAETEKKPVFIIGSSAPDIQKAVDIFLDLHPKMNICGYRDGYFSDKDQAEVIQSIIDAKPDIVIVGMGALKQELFLEALKTAGFQGTAYSCGGFIHQTANAEGHYYPDWINRYNLRWLYRMLKEPNVARRYFLTYPLAVVSFIADFMAKRLVINKVQ